MRIIVEIGANNGDDTAKLLKDADVMYACEPDPALVNTLVSRFAAERKLKIWACAIDLTEGEKELHVMEHERGINSLYPLHPNLLETPLQKHWQYQRGMTHKVTIQTKRLDTLIKENNIPHIDYMWIDAQGNDLIALKSMGEYINILRAGRLECTYKVPIYEGVDNSYESVVQFLSSHGFNHAIDYVHQDESEVDVRFWRREDDGINTQ